TDPLSLPFEILDKYLSDLAGPASSRDAAREQRQQVVKTRRLCVAVGSSDCTQNPAAVTRAGSCRMMWGACTKFRNTRIVIEQCHCKSCKVRRKSRGARPVEEPARL